jgi:hypothetical protein
VEDVVDVKDLRKCSEDVDVDVVEDVVDVVEDVEMFFARIKQTKSQAQSAMASLAFGQREGTNTLSQAGVPSWHYPSL